MHNGQYPRQALDAPRGNDNVSVINSLNKLKIVPVDDDSSVNSFEVNVPDQPVGTNKAQARPTMAEKVDVSISKREKAAAEQPVQHISLDEGCEEDSIPEYYVARANFKFQHGFFYTFL